MIPSIDHGKLSGEQLQDLEAGLGLAISIINGMLKDAEQALIRAKCASYEDYLNKYAKVQALDMIVGDLQGIMQKRKEA